MATEWQIAGQATISLKIWSLLRETGGLLSPPLDIIYQQPVETSSHRYNSVSLKGLLILFARTKVNIPEFVSNFNPENWLHREKFSGLLRLLQEKAGIHTNSLRYEFNHPFEFVIRSHLSVYRLKSIQSRRSWHYWSWQSRGVLTATQHSAHRFVPFFFGPNQTHLRVHSNRLITESPTHSIMITLTSSKLSCLFTQSPNNLMGPTSVGGVNVFT